MKREDDDERDTSEASALRELLYRVAIKREEGDDPRINTKPHEWACISCHFVCFSGSLVSFFYSATWY